MQRIQLRQIAHARSGDKGDSSNVGLIADNEAAYAVIRNEVTPELVKKHFANIVNGEVDRYELPNLLCLNFHQILINKRRPVGARSRRRSSPTGRRLLIRIW